MGRKAVTSRETKSMIMRARCSDHKLGNPVPSDLWLAVLVVLKSPLCVERLMCMQFPQRPEENMGSPGATAADIVDLPHFSAGNPPWSSASAVHILSSPSHLSSPKQSALHPEFSSLRFCCMRCDCGCLGLAGHFCVCSYDLLIRAELPVRG